VILAQAAGGRIAFVSVVVCNQNPCEAGWLFIGCFRTDATMSLTSSKRPFYPISDWLDNRDVHKPFGERAKSNDIPIVY
jgi:hypothetical protein